MELVSLPKGIDKQLPHPRPCSQCGRAGRLVIAGKVWCLLCWRKLEPKR